MTVRAAAVLLACAERPAPPGVEPHELALAMAEDVVDVVVGMAGVDVVVAHTSGRAADAAAVRWPSGRVADLGTPSAPAIAALDDLAAAGADVGVVLAADVPDLPGLVLAKPFSALSSALAAVAPAEDGRSVALACRLPVPSWFRATGIGLDTRAGYDLLAGAAPRRRDVRRTLSWRRYRDPGDIGSFDPGLEGWEATRALLET